MACDWPWGLFLSPEKEHELFICSLVRVGYTDLNTDGCKRYFPFKLFVNDAGLKKAPLRQDPRALLKLLSCTERAVLAPTALFAGTLCFWPMHTRPPSLVEDLTFHELGSKYPLRCLLGTEQRKPDPTPFAPQFTEEPVGFEIHF